MGNRAFRENKKHLAFGMMRLPMIDGKIDNEQVCRMVDRFLEMGFNYFDTAHGYHDGLSEIAVRECLTSRHDRSEYVLTDKLTDEYFKSEEDIRPLIDLQLETCGVEYFDFLLMHAQNAKNFEFFKQCRAYETAFDLKAEGKVRHVGLSFHDKAEVLDRILTEYPDVEIVQIQFNYLDYESVSVESRKVYEVCRRHNKPVLVMEPVRGGNLVNLPEAAQKIFDDLRDETGSDCSNAGYALRFAAGFDGMEMVLSGMSNIEQMADNTSYMSDFKPLSEEEMKVIEKVQEIYKNINTIPCTACHYCTEGCPMGIPIPDIFRVRNNQMLQSDDPKARERYERVTLDKGKASDCIQCGQCESVCPQHINIIERLIDCAENLE